MIKGFFFDLDGTLVNTYEADYLAYHDAVAEVTGWELLQADYAALHGMEIAAKLRKIFADINDEQIDQIRASKKRHYAAHVHLTQANEALVKFMAQLAAHQHCVLVTTAKKANVDLVLKHHNLGQYFSFIINGDDVQKHKPDPEAYLMALQKSGLKASEVLAFEDTQSGIDAAEAAGIAVVHIKEFAPA